MHHVGSATTAGKREHYIGPKLVQHALIANRPRRTTVRTPIGTVLDYGNATGHRPFPGARIGSRGTAMRQHINGKVVKGDAQRSALPLGTSHYESIRCLEDVSVLENRNTPKRSPTAYEDSHSPTSGAASVMMHAHNLFASASDRSYGTTTCAR
jgi:hypothetical protein